MKMLSPRLILLILISVSAVGVAIAQDNPPPDRGRARPDMRRDDRPNPLRMLGLTPDQTQQIRRMNQARKPEMDRAGLRLRLATRALDETIYADNVDENAFQTRLKEFQAAQAEMARLRFTGELGVRKVLTPEQLAKFLQFRRRFSPPPADQPGPGGMGDKDLELQRTRRQQP